MRLHGQQQGGDIGRGDIRHFQFTQGGINPMVEITLVGAAPIFTHRDAFGGHKHRFSILAQRLYFCGAVKKVPQQGSQCLPALATKNQEETAAAS